MIGKGRILLALIATLVLIPATAQARPFNEADMAMFNDAVAYWGQTPHCDVIEAWVEPVLPGGDYMAGLATLATEPQERCELTIKEDLSECYEARVMEHEVGHLIGLEHSSDPNSIMNATVPAGPCEYEFQYVEPSTDEGRTIITIHEPEVAQSSTIVTSWWPVPHHHRRNHHRIIRRKTISIYHRQKRG